jgi:ABC-2 type transport system ATP-binding protein
MTPEFVIETRRLAKRYGSVEAVCGLDICVFAGRITGFLGRNGAGKSTSIKMLMGMIEPSAGDAMVLGRSIRNAQGSCDARRHIAYVAENKPLYGYMTVAQIIAFSRSFYPDWDADLERRLLRGYDLPADRKIRSLSKGMRTKLALLLALARRPQLLILDEPSEGLDPVMAEEMLETLAARSADGVAVFFSSHQIAEVERIADQVLILNHGALVTDASLDDLRNDYRRIDLVFSSAPRGDDFRLAGVESVRAAGRQMTVLANGTADLVVEHARRLHATSIEVAPVALREIFLEKVRDSQ